MTISNCARLKFGTLAAACLLIVSAPMCRGGEIAGVLKPSERVTSVSAVDRESGMAFAAAYDARTGEYRVRNVPAGVYDLVLDTAAGRIEGVNLRVDSPEVKAKPTVLKPAELDKDEIVRVVEFLSKLYAERKGEKPAGDAMVGRIRDSKLASAGLVKGKFGAEGSTVFEVPLKNDEPSQLGDMLLGLIALARVRDDLPGDFDLVIDLPEGNPGDICVVPAAPELTQKDRDWLIDWVNHLDIFENKKRVLDLDGTGERAKVLVEKLRDKQEGVSLPAKEPAAIWRVEYFDFKKFYGGWDKGKYTVVVRENVPLRKFHAYRWMFEKRLGGIRVATDGVTNVPVYEVPEKPDPARSVAPF